MTETSFERANRLAMEAKAAAKARSGLDWSRYEPLAQGEPLEARDSVEAEVWPEIERQARRWHGIQDLEGPPDMVEFLSVLREVLIELKAEDAHRRRMARPLREVLAARQMTLAYIDTGSGRFMPVEVPLVPS